MSPLFGPSPDKILATGTPVPGTVVGIEIKSTHDDSPTLYGEYAVEAGGTVYGIRQDLDPFDEVRLGMPVTLRLDGKNAVIEWRDSGTNRWKMLGTPPAAGIVDDHDDNGNRGGRSRAQKGGKPATVTLLEIVPRTVAMGLASTLDGRVRVDPADGEPYETTVPNINRVMGYAAHLPVVGARLPAWETKGFFGGEGVMIDWPAAAMATPGLDAPNVVFEKTGGVASGLLGKIVADTEAVATDQPPAEGEMPEIPQYAKDIMKKFGVDPESLK